MFNNFIYFIIAILIYSTYSYSGAAEYSPLSETLLIFFSLALVFFLFVFIRFKELERKITKESHRFTIHKFDSLLKKRNSSISCRAYIETFEERPILLKFKEGENFNHRNTLKYFED